MSGTTIGRRMSQAFERDVLRGLGQTKKTLPCKYLYDRRGSELFEAICDLEEYYPTRTELSILAENADAMAGRCGAGCLLIEPGSGAGVKTELLLSRLEEPSGYVPIEISPTALAASSARLASRFPDLAVIPVVGDFTRVRKLPGLRAKSGRRVVYFPASTIGNFTRMSAVRLLERFANWAGKNGGILLGVDLWKDKETLLAAYDDSSGVTAAFNKNLLVRINRELGGTFAVERFRHEARISVEHRRVEMHLASLDEASVRVRGRVFSFAAGESICTEHSHKYDLADMDRLAGEAGLCVKQVWTDARDRFCVAWLERCVK